MLIYKPYINELSVCRERTQIWPTGPLPGLQEAIFIDLYAEESTNKEGCEGE